MIFKTINSKIEKPSYNIEIKNIDMATGHWNSEKYVSNYLDTIENFLLKKEDFTNNIVQHAIALMKDNNRIRDILFYRDQENNRLILLATTLVGKFKEPEIFSREMTISFKKSNFVFSIVELLDAEEKILKQRGIKFPEKWIPDVELNKRLDFARMIAFC